MRCPASFPVGPAETVIGFDLIVKNTPIAVKQIQHGKREGNKKTRAAMGFFFSLLSLHTDGGRSQVTDSHNTQSAPA